MFDVSDPETAGYWLAWIQRGTIVAAFFVAAGVGYEFLAAWISRPLETIVEHSRQAELERLRAETAQANARAAEANEKAETERLARLKIEEKLAPRSLSAQQQASVAAKLKPFAGSTVDLFAYNDAEPILLANQIADILQSAGWKIVAALGTEMGRNVRGLLIEMKDAGSTHRAAAQALADTFRAERIATIGPAPEGGTGRSFSSQEGFGKAPILLVVGSKP